MRKDIQQDAVEQGIQKETIFSFKNGPETLFEILVFTKSKSLWKRIDLVIK